jgi:glycerol kinase
MAHLIGLDIGTTAAKTLIVSEDGQVVASASVEYPIYAPRPNWSEQNRKTGGGQPCRASVLPSRRLRSPLAS